jgi:hypothetical protein
LVLPGLDQEVEEEVFEARELIRRGLCPESMATSLTSTGPYLESLRHAVREADGELLHLWGLQPLLLCLELCASLHHHLEETE